MKDLISRIKDKFNIACYSPKLNKVILINGGKCEHMDQKGKSEGFFYHYADEELFGKTMKAEKFESLYTVCWELVDGVFEQKR